MSALAEAAAKYREAKAEYEAASSAAFRSNLEDLAANEELLEAKGRFDDAKSTLWAAIAPPARHQSPVDDPIEDFL